MRLFYIIIYIYVCSDMQDMMQKSEIQMNSVVFFLKIKKKGSSIARFARRPAGRELASLAGRPASPAGQ